AHKLVGTALIRKSANRPRTDHVVAAIHRPPLRGGLGIPIEGAPMRGHAPDHSRTREAIGSALEVRDQRSNAVRLTGAVRDAEAPQLEHRLAPIAQVRGA